MRPVPESVPVDRLLQDSRLSHLGLRLVAGSSGVQRLVTNPRLQKPGLALAGFLASVKPGRVQVDVDVDGADLVEVDGHACSSGTNNRSS